VNANRATIRRRGSVLVVVLAMTTMFAVAAVAFIYFSEKEAVASRLNLDAQHQIRPSMDTLLGYALNQLCYDTHVQNSVLRRHSLARNLFGGTGTTPFNSPGRRRFSETLDGLEADAATLLNYTQRGNTLPEDQFEQYYGRFNPPYTYPDHNHPFLGAQRGSDGMVLARSFARPVVFLNLPSQGGRPFVFDPYHPAWYDFFWRNGAMPAGLPSELAALANAPNLKRAMVMRPGPWDHPNFPAPEDHGGDVKNLPAGTAVLLPDGSTVWYGNDSIWLDLGYPVQVDPATGKRYKPLFAFFITDLDNRLNLNVHGNIQGAGTRHLSNHGIGAHEVNIGRIINRGDVVQLFTGIATANGNLPGKFGAGQTPTGTTGQWAPGPSTQSGQSSYLPHFYAQLDWNGDATSRLVLPDAMNPLPFPTYPASFENGSANERTNHALLFNPYNNAAGTRLFKPQMMEALLRSGDTGGDALSSELRYLLPQSVTNGAIRRRITTDSWDVVRPGLLPYLVYDPADPNRQFNYGFRSAAEAHLAPRDLAGGIAFPTAAGPRPSAIHEFADKNWHYAGFASTKLDLGRFLPPYPHMGTGTTAATYNDGGAMAARFDDGGADETQFTTAQRARQALTLDLYNRLIQVTGVPPCADAANPTDAELAPRRWLAQLAVNMVDYLDEDEINTPFCFYGTAADASYHPASRGLASSQDQGMTIGGNAELPRYWVFGTELPRVVLSEVLAEYRLPVMNQAGENVTIRVWVELFNPLTAGGPSNTQQRDFQPVPLHVAGQAMTQPAFEPYKIVLARPRADGGLLLPTSWNENVLGSPQTPISQTSGDGTSFPAMTTTVDPANTVATAIGPRGYLIVGPIGNTAEDTISAANGSAGAPAAVPFVQVPTAMNTGLEYQQLLTAMDEFPDRRTGVGVLLRRLANPYLPPDPNPVVEQLDAMGMGTGNYQLNPRYNPYITVDYAEPVRLWNRTNPGQSSRSWSKRRPYESPISQWVRENRQVMLKDVNLNDVTTSTYHTLGQQNSTEAVPTWLTHLDRQLISPIELLHVSGFKPHELLHQFVGTGRTTLTQAVTAGQAQAATPAAGLAAPLPFNMYSWQIDVGDRLLVDIGERQEVVTVTAVDLMAGTFTADFANDHDPGCLVVGLSKLQDPNDPNSAVPVRFRFNHYVPWFDQTRRLYRVFEFLETLHARPGATLGGRTPGKININTLWLEDGEVFRALCDANAANFFTDADVDAIFRQLAQQRTPRGLPDAGDRPFWGFMPGFQPADPNGQYPSWKYPNGFGINETLLAAFDRNNTSSTARRLLEVGQGQSDPYDHPYVKMELLTKIFNNVTTRSNVFAVWLTIGYFEVDSAGRLGQEIGRLDNRHKRHRAFAIVDRTQLMRSAIQVQDYLGHPEYDARKSYRLSSGTLQPPVVYWSIIE